MRTKNLNRLALDKAAVTLRSEIGRIKGFLETAKDAIRATDKKKVMELVSDYEKDLVDVTTSLLAKLDKKEADVQLKVLKIEVRESVRILLSSPKVV